MKPSVTFGLIGGVGTVAYLLLCYWIDRELLINPVVRHLTWLPYIVCMFLPLLILRREQSLTFKDALREAFIVYIIANICFYVFDYIMLSYVDQGLVDLIDQELQKAIDEGLINLEKSEGEKIDHSPTISFYLLSFAQSLIAGFILSAGLALIFKNQK